MLSNRKNPYMFRLVLLTGAVTAFALPAGASAFRLQGTVVHQVSRAGTFVLATPSGRLTAVHARRRPAIGRVVTVRAARRADGALTARAVRRRGLRRHARLRGTVTHVGRRAFVLSAQGTSLLVRRNRVRSVPVEGSVAIVDATLTRDGELAADDVDVTGTDQTYELEGVVKALDTAAGTLTISADDEDESGATQVVTFPAGTDLAQFGVGEEVELLVTRAEDGTLTGLRARSDDEYEQGDDQQGADDDAQGDDDRSGDGDDGGSPNDD